MNRLELWPIQPYNAHTTQELPNMTIGSRRDFLKHLGVLSALLAAGRGNLALSHVDDERPFNMLIVGDSVIWGQGLEETDKFYTLIADWLRKEAFGKRCEVNVKVKAHSGSTLKFHPDEAEKYKKAGRNEADAFNPEVNVGFPSSWKQIEMAADEYRAEGKGGADLMMICGGITDITTSRVFDPKGNDDELRSDIKRYCGDNMFDVLQLAADRNPNALLVVIGYFPVITPYSQNGKMLNAWLEALSFPRMTKFFVNNPIVRPMVFNKLKKRGIDRSRIWLEESNRNFQAAVTAINEKYNSKRAILVRTPLTEENGAEAPKTMLLRMGKNGVVEDAVAQQRIKDCRETLPKLKSSTGIDYPVRLCEIAAVGHPNPAGARAYAESIKSLIGPIIH